MGGICPWEERSRQFLLARQTPPRHPKLPPTHPKDPSPLPSGWLVGVIAKHKGSGRSLSPAGTKEGGQAVFPSLLYLIFYHPRGWCLTATPAHLSVTWFCEEGEGAEAGAEEAGVAAGGGAGVQRISDRSSMIQVSLGSTRLNSLTKTMKCAYRVFKWPCRSRATVSLKCAQ